MYVKPFFIVAGTTLGIPLIIILICIVKIICNGNEVIANGTPFWYVNVIAMIATSALFPVMITLGVLMCVNVGKPFNKKKKTTIRWEYGEVDG